MKDDEMKQRLNNLEVKADNLGGRMAGLEQKTTDIKELVVNNCRQIEVINEKIDCLPDKLASRFASKWTEKVLLTLMGIIFSGFVGLIIYLIQRHIL